ncbi:MAG: hypothetical protein AABX85_02940 [Nanoarchaeota archaeon]
MTVEIKRLPCNLLNEEATGLCSGPLRPLEMAVQANVEENGNFKIEDIFCPYVRKDYPGRLYYCPLRANKFVLGSDNCIYSPDERTTGKNTKSP